MRQYLYCGGTEVRVIPDELRVFVRVFCAEGGGLGGG